MDQELRETLAGMSAQLSDVATDARQSSTFSRETMSAVNRLTTRVESLETAVFGGKPPTIPPTVPVVARITEGEGTVADLTGRVMALQASHEEHVRSTAEYRKANDAKQDEQLETLRAIKGAVSGVLTHPLARKVALAAGVAALAWLGTVQARIEARAEKIEHVIDGGGAK